MKKRTLLSLSIVSTMSLLTLTSCGSNNDTSVSAMNEIPMPIETSSIEMSEFDNLRAQVGDTEEIGKDDEAKTTVTVDSTSADIPFTEGEERGEDLSTVEESTEPAETINTTGERTLPFTIDDFDLSEDDKGFVQYVMDSYEAGNEDVDYLFVLSVLADAGVDTTKLYDDYEKSQGTSSNSNSTTNTQQSQQSQQPDNTSGNWGVPEAPAVTGTLSDNPYHPELSDVHAY